MSLFEIFRITLGKQCQHVDCECRFKKDMMNNVRSLSFVIFVAFSLLSCQKTDPNAAHIAVEFEWTEKSGCSSVSPPIRILNVPKEVKTIKVSMVDLDMPTYDHGGGEVSYNGSSIIPEGSLNPYSGPCPPSGTEHRYEISVEALTAGKELIIGTGKTVRTFSK